MSELVASIIKEGLILLNKIVPDEATKISNLLLENRRNFDAELAKGSARDDALLDMYERELRDIGELFLGALKSASSSGKP